DRSPPPMALTLTSSSIFSKAGGGRIANGRESGARRDTIRSRLRCQGQSGARDFDSRLDRDLSGRVVDCDRAERRRVRVALAPTIDDLRDPRVLPLGMVGIDPCPLSDL